MKPLARESPLERREFLMAAGSLTGLAIGGCATGASRTGAPSAAGGERAEAEVTPGEDLMQEHGVLERILLVYGESARRLERGLALDLALLTTAAGLVRRFVEDYHEALEEQFVFPRLEAARREVELVAVLRAQHRRGRELTDEVTRMARGGNGERQLAQLLRSFERMYRPHMAREDTVLFPAFRQVVGGGAYRELGEAFEAREHERFGEHGFQTTVAEVARLEAALAIDDLARFTPPAG